MAHEPIIRKLTIVGLYDDPLKEFSIQMDGNITAVVGPNGSGKSTALNALKAVLENDLLYFLTVHYTSLKIELFSVSDNDYVQLFVEIPRYKGIKEKKNYSVLRYGIKKTGKPKESNLVTSFDLSSYFSLNSVARTFYEEEVSRRGYLIDRRTDEQKLAVVYKKNKDLLSSYYHYTDEEWRDVVGTFSCSYLGTERAQSIMPSSGELAGLTSFAYQIAPKPFNITILEEDMRGRISNAGAEYSKISQRLDGDFAQNVLHLSPVDVDQARLDASAAVYNNAVDKVTNLNLIDKNQISRPLNFENVSDPVTRNLINLYYSNSIKKLEPYEKLATRVSLFLNILRRRMTDKVFFFNPSLGIECHTFRGRVPLESLSSGEKHFFVIHYYLCFVAKPNSVLLIDEPEISWNVNWQESFVEDMRIPLNVSGAQVIFATHSPMIVEDCYDIVKEVGRE